jgi:dihydrofolate reductase
MADLIYSAIMSLDGYIEDQNGNFDWAEPDGEVHQYINDLVRHTGTHLYGRRMYETMRGWESVSDLPDQPFYIRDFATIWQAADKIVFSTSLEGVSTSRTRTERQFIPEDISQLKAAARQDILIGGPNLAATAFEAGLIDQCQVFITPVVVGGGKQGMPENIRLGLQLEQERRFTSGIVFLRYRVV